MREDAELGQEVALHRQSSGPEVRETQRLVSGDAGIREKELPYRQHVVHERRDANPWRKRGMAQDRAAERRETLVRAKVLREQLAVGGLVVVEEKNDGGSRHEQAEIPGGRRPAMPLADVPKRPRPLPPSADPRCRINRSVVDHDDLELRARQRLAGETGEAI